MRTRRARVPWAVYVRRVLGEGGVGHVTKTMVQRSFTAPSLREFWHHWNPGSGYVLAYFVYRPLRKTVSANAALLFTFAFSGFAFHDAPIWLITFALHVPLPFPVVTVAFTVCAVLILLSERLRVGFVDFKLWQRCVIHVATLAFSFTVSIGIEAIIRVASTRMII